MFTWLPCLRGSAFVIPTLIRVIRLPRRSREEAGAIHGSLKRKFLSHSSPGKFERSSRNCFQRGAISNLPALERLTGDRALSKTRRGVLGATIFAATIIATNLPTRNCGVVRTQMLAAAYKPGKGQIRKSRLPWRAC